MVLGIVKLKQRNSTISPSTRGRDVSKEITKEFTIVSYETLYIVIRNSKNWLDREEVHRNGQIGTGRPLLPSIQRGIPEISKTLVSHIQSGKNAPRLRSEFRTAVTIMNRLHRESGEESAEPIPFQQYQRCYTSSSSGSWWNWDTSKSWWSSRVQF